MQLGLTKSYLRWVLFALFILSFAIHLVGIRKDLPYLTHFDEYIFVTPAVSIASSGSLNPGWFGHPGSTVIYPLALVYRLQYWLAQAGILSWLGADLPTRFASNPASFYLIGRTLTILYAIMSLPFIYIIGRKAFDERVGVIGAWLTLFYTVAIYHAQIVRTDSAATFFCVLSLWRILEVYERPSKLNHLWAGICIGLGISSRYFMVTLIPLLLAVDLLLLLRAKRIEKELIIAASIGLVAVLVTFMSTTPYFFLDFDTASSNLAGEAGDVAPGSDGLSRMGNFIWYLREALPSTIYWHQVNLVIVGILVVAMRKQMKPGIFLGYLGLYLISISLSALHKQRWLIQILPILALFAAYGLVALVEWLSGRLRLTLKYQRYALLLGVFLISLWPAYDLAIFDVRQSNYSTQVLAREWIIENLPVESRIYQEAYCAPMEDTEFFIKQRFSLAAEPLSYYYKQEFDYLVVSSSIYQRFLAEPERYPEEVAFYQTLFEKGRMVHLIQQSMTRGGPTIRIYKLPKRNAYQD